jgi:hypothetical protein
MQNKKFYICLNGIGMGVSQLFYRLIDPIFGSQIKYEVNSIYEDARFLCDINRLIIKLIY